ncbi:Ppx/GppA phosphatase family protein [Gloeocapsa sp. PCC 73106]|uniref:Ppx/GppA phosphatase family protein n=1 Tax=Gloeocapsa sp. PCC 73106 TaxID=102232 RepID=UPI0002ACFBDD|nr:Ppx/GppA phosphatase family protein [Gloeocapsa sp. PCC 73106]ELR97115.1 exopolyphosphatase [Gloeocapsa sp. PCC 73106]
MVDSLTKDIDDCILAAIDIGTNSVHMVIVRIDASLPAFTIIAREKDTVRLGDRNLETGELTPEAMTRAIDALKRCRALAVSLKAQHIIAVATSATREAPNGRAFLNRIQSEVGISVDLISGQEEARRIYLGVLSGLDFQQIPHIIIDIGGGSTELILADSQEPRFLSSTKVGAVRLAQDFITTDPISNLEFLQLQSYIKGMLERPIENILQSLKLGEEPRLVGTSGTIETLAIVNAINKSGTIPTPLQGYHITRREVRDLVKQLATMSHERRTAIPGMSEKRAEIILPGAMILLEAMNMLNIERLTLCERSLREGIIVDWMLTHGLIESRLRYQTEVRQRSVMKIAHKYQINLNYAQKAANFALSLFDQLQGVLHNWKAQAKELLWAGAILHNSGLYISHAAHHKHSYYLIRNAELLGYTESEIEIIANLARYHRKSKPKKKHENYNNLPDKESRQLVRQLSAILRIAIALDRRQIGAISRVECKYDSEYRRLHLHLIPAYTDDECALELWSLDYKKDAFEEEYGVKIIATLHQNIYSSPNPKRKDETAICTTTRYRNSF